MKPFVKIIQDWISDRSQPGASYKIPCPSSDVAESLIEELHYCGIASTYIDCPEPDCYVYGVPHKIVDEGEDKILMRLFWYVVVTR